MKMLLIRTNPFKNAISSASENVVNWGRRVVVLVDSFWKLFSKSSKVDVGPFFSFLFFDIVNISRCGVLDTIVEIVMGLTVVVVVVVVVGLVFVVDFIWIGIRVVDGRCKRRCWQIQTQIGIWNWMNEWTEWVEKKRKQQQQCQRQQYKIRILNKNEWNCHSAIANSFGELIGVEEQFVFWFFFFFLFLFTSNLLLDVKSPNHRCLVQAL